MKKKILFFSALFLCLAYSFSFAAFEKRPQIFLKQGYRYEYRRKRHRLYTNRLSALFTYRNQEANHLFKIEPFFEMRRNIVWDLWERKELGVEFGKDIFPWFYLGESIQQVWVKEDHRYYRVYEKENFTESETRLMFSHNLLDSKYLKLKGFILGEYTYDFNWGAGVRNEAVAGLSIPLGRHIETTIDWRHVDRIHYYDSDTFEAWLSLVF